MKRTAIVTLVLMAFVAVPAVAQTKLDADPTLPTTRVGTRGATFLNLGVGARAQALAGAYTALADGVDALYWNPAGIGHLDGFAAAFTQASLFQDLDIDHVFAGVVIPIGLNRLGVSLNVLSSGTMAWTEAGYPNPPPFGEDANPTRATFEWTSTAMGVHLARPITDRLVFGGALKLVEEGIAQAKANFIAFDLGTQFETGLYGITLGAALTNLGSSGEMRGQDLDTRVNTGNTETQISDQIRILEFRAKTTEVELPTSFRFSILANLIGSADAILMPNPDQNLRMVWDLNDSVDTDLQTSLGVEYSFRDLAFIRVGKRWTNEAQIEYDFTRNTAFGGGVNLPVGEIGNLKFDYAYTDMGELENVQVFSIQVQF